MRVLRTVLMIGVTIASISPAAADRYCLQGGTYGYPGNCQFATYHQCKASASGTISHCGINPRYAHHRHPHE